MSRLSLSGADKQARDWFAETTQSLGCKVTVDAMGNQFAVRPGASDGVPVYAGSHLDTQPTVRFILRLATFHANECRGVGMTVSLESALVSKCSRHLTTTGLRPHIPLVL